MYRTNKGISLIEFIIVLAVLAILAALSAQAFIKAAKRESLTKNAEIAVALLQDARSKTLSFKDFSLYGVHFEEDKIISFSGSSYVANNPENIATDLDGSIFISSVNLSGGGSEVIFERLTGGTTNYGTIIFAISGNESVTKTVTINSTGIISTN